MTIGQKIRESRKQKGMTLEALAACCGKRKSWLCSVENDALKSGVDPETLIVIADALSDQSILTHALLENPICKRVVPRAFEPLNNIVSEVSAIFEVLGAELEEANESRGILARVFTHKCPKNQPMFKEVLMANLEQILDVQRTVEELISCLKDKGFLSDEEHLEVMLRQQAKCIANGHHIPEGRVA